MSGGEESVAESEKRSSAGREAGPQREQRATASDSEESEDVSDSEERICGLRREDGSQCGTTFGLCDLCGFCWNHCPHRAERRREASSRGGRKTNLPEGAAPPYEVPPPPETLEDAVLWCAWAGHAVATGELGTTRANAAAKLLREFRQALERSEAKAELEEIRKQVEELTGGSSENGEEPDLEALL